MPVKVEGLREFRAALRASEVGSTRQLSAALRVASLPVVHKASSFAPSRTGALRGGYGVSVRGTRASIINRVPYAAGAEWGVRGKWAGFLKYPGPEGGRGRFAYRAVHESETLIVQSIYLAMRKIITVNGWLHGF